MINPTDKWERSPFANLVNLVNNLGTFSERRSLRLDWAFDLELSSRITRNHSVSVPASGYKPVKEPCQANKHH